MLSIGKVTGGREDYYLDLSAEGYPGEAPGFWLGDAAARLGLAGTVGRDDFKAVLAGNDPRDHTPLVATVGRAGRVPGFDLTFSAPKSVSVTWALADPEVADRVADAHDRAVADAMTVFAAEVVRARRGAGGVRQVETDGVVAAAFAHRASRAGDPQLHTHVVVANLTVDGDGRWSAPDGRRVYGWAKTVGYLYQAALRHHLTETLGVQWGPVGNGAAEMAGFTGDQLAGFSQRRTQITDRLDQLGHTGPKAAAVATLDTRPAKEPAATLEVLRDRWAGRAAAMDLPDIDSLLGRATTRAPDPNLVVGGLLAPGGLTLRSSSFDRRDVLQGLAAAHRSGAPVTDLRAAADRVQGDPAVVALTSSTPEGGQRFSTAELVAVETGLLARATGRVGAGVAVVPVPALERALSQRPSLSAEQRAMVARVTRSGAGVEVIVGRAGAGKTFALDAARSAWETTGTPVIGAALAARAALELQSGSGISSVTVDRLLIDAERPGPGGGLPVGSVVVIDEAGMVGTRKLARLLEVAEHAQAKVVLVGDPRQLPEIDAGGAFAALARDLGAVELVDNRRQHLSWERAALVELRAGSVAAAVVAYNDAGRVTMAATAEGARAALVGDWWQARQGGAQAAMYALHRSDVEDLNSRARQHLGTAGLLGDETMVVGGREFAAGDDIVFLRNDRRVGVINGATATVVAVDPDATTLTAAHGAGDQKVEIVIPEGYLAAGHVGHGYATTIHKGQGATVDEAFLLGSQGLYREAGYTGASRARHGTRLYLVAPPPRGTMGHDDMVEPVMELAARLGVSRAQLLAAHQLPPVAPAGQPKVARPIGDLAVDARGLAATLTAHPPQRETDGQQWAVEHRGAIERWQDLHQAMTAQRNALGVAALYDPPPHLVDTLGAPPAAGADRHRWAVTAGLIEGYRAEHGVDGTADVLGPRPDDTADLVAWRHTRGAIDNYHQHHLDQGLTL